MITHSVPIVPSQKDISSILSAEIVLSVLLLLWKQGHDPARMGRHWRRSFRELELNQSKIDALAFPPIYNMIDKTLTKNGAKLWLYSCCQNEYKEKQADRS